MTRESIGAEEAAIRAADAEWFRAAQSLSIERSLFFWADDALVLPPGAPAITGREAIRKFISEAFAMPGFSLTWKMERLEVAQSCDIAFAVGSSRVTFTSGDGRKVTEESKSASIWKKQQDGQWKIAVDIWNAAAPPPASS